MAKRTVEQALRDELARKSRDVARIELVLKRAQERASAAQREAVAAKDLLTDAKLNRERIQKALTALLPDEVEVREKAADG